MMSDLRYRLRALFARSDMDRDLNDELRFHLDRETEKLMKAGLTRHEAYRRARLSFGGVDRIVQDTRDARGISIVDTVQQDLRYAWRGLRAKPGFASAIILALALGIGANTAMFSIVDHLLFRPPAYLIAPDRVHRVYWAEMTTQGEDVERTMQYTRYADLTRWTTSFDRTAVVGYRSLAVGMGEQTREMSVAAASASLFDLFDARPVIGRFFSADEDRPPKGASVGVLGYSFWQVQYGGRRDILGTRLNVGSLVVTIIGVAPPNFVGITDELPPVVIVPVTALAGARNSSYYQNYHWSWLEMFARRKAGVTMTQANADLTTAYRRSWQAQALLDPMGKIEAANPHAFAGSLHLSRGPEASADSRVVTWVMGVAAIVLLVACANVANLLLARAVSRRREIALRIALGVSRRRLVQQVATESVLLAALGAAAGLVVANWGGRVLRGLFISDGDKGGLIDARTLGFAMVATVAVALLTGLAPAFHALRGDINDALKAGSRDSAYRRSRLSTALLLFQGALSVVLLVGAGLFARSLSNVRSMRLGYDVEPLVLIAANMRGTNLKLPEQRALNARMLEATEGTAGVTSATMTVSVPFWSNEGQGPPRVPGKDSLHKLGRFLLQAGSPSYFQTVGTRILAGRGILATDRENTQRVSIITQKMATSIWPGENAIGKQFHVGDDSVPFLTVVGIAEDMRGRLITASDEIWYYVPETQYPTGYPQIFARVNGRSEDYIDVLRRRLQPLLPGMAYVNVIPLKNMVSARQRSWEFGAKMFMAFGGLALLLSAIGLYSVIAYAVAQRTRELGVRIALGASSGNVIRMIVGQGVIFALAGVAIGTLIALAGSRWVEPLLFAQSAKDPAVFIGVGSVLLVVAIVASARPAIRAMRVDPSEVLRSD